MWYITGAMIFVFLICVLAFFKAARDLSWSDEEQAMDDQEQIEYLAAWAEQRNYNQVVESEKEPGI